MTPQVEGGLLVLLLDTDSGGVDGDIMTSGAWQVVSN